MRLGGLKCSLFRLGLSSTRLQTPNPAASSSTLTSPGGGPLRRRQWCLARPFYTLKPVTRSNPSHPSHPNGSGGIYVNALTRNTRAPGCWLAHPHPHSHLVSSLPAHAHAPVLLAPVGRSSHWSTRIRTPDAPKCA